MSAPVRRLPLACAVAAVLASTAFGAHAEWPACAEGFRIPARPVPEAVEPGADPKLIRLSADEVELVEEEVSRLTGNVTLERGIRLLRSDEVVHDQPGGVIEATGNVRLWDGGVFVAGEAARAEIGNDVVAVAPAAAFMLGDEQGHGQASRVEVIGDERMTAHDVTYTTCSPDDAEWRITADRVEFDRTEETAAAQGAWLELKGRRVLYVPGISFPVSDRRKSGFLAPTFGTDSATGVEITAPYYFNLAPNRDATLSARTMTERGVQAQGELRFLSREYGAGRIAAEYLPFDARFDDARTAFDLTHRHGWTSGWSTDTHVEWASDPEYLQDLGIGLSQSSRTYLSRRFDATYRGDGWDALVRLQGFQTLDRMLPAHDRPYTRLPQVLIRTDTEERSRTLNAATEAELTYFHRRSLTTGVRARLRPAFSYPIHTTGAFVTPRATLHITGYDLDRAHGEASLDDHLASVVPAFSLDSGVFLERPVTLSGRSLVHTIEPRLHYLLVPYERQDDLPNFDTSQSTFSFARLFQENRFSGADRIGDANRLTLALTSRVLDERGGELARASIGQIRHFRDRRVVLDPTGTAETADASGIVAEIEARPDHRWRLRAGFQYDTEDDRARRSLLNVRYQHDSRSVFNAAWRRVRDIGPVADIEQADLSFVWPIGARWRTIGRWSVALDEDRSRTVEAFGGVAYESCCLAVRAVARRLLRRDAGTGDDRYSDGLYLQVELRGLTGAGRRPDALLTGRIPGYENDF